MSFRGRLNRVFGAVIFSTFTITASTQSNASTHCRAMRVLEPLFFKYSAMINPVQDTGALYAARSVRLASKNRSAERVLADLGLLQESPNFQDLAIALRGAFELSDIWLAGQPITQSDLGRWHRERDQMKAILIDSGCFSKAAGFDQIPSEAELIESGPMHLSVEISPAMIRQNLQHELKKTAKNIPSRKTILWLLALTAGLISGWQALKRLRRLQHRTQRNFSREVMSGALVFESSTGEFEVKVADIGRGGAKVGRDSNLEAPDNLQLIWGGEKYPATVAWSNDHFSGIQFQTPLTDAIVKDILDK